MVETLDGKTSNLNKSATKSVEAQARDRLEELIALDRAYFGQRPFKTDQKQT
jgi:hypothetical protein